MIYQLCNAFVFTTWNILQVTCIFSIHKPSGECVYQVNTSDKWEIPWFTAARERCITILFHAIEKTVASNINEAYAQCMMGKLDMT